MSFILETVPCGRDDLILDVGAGTGKLTRELTSSEATVVAVDPVAEMVRLVPEFAPGAHVALGVAESLPVASGSVDAITCGQSFHWFDAEAAWSEFARALRPGGVVALVWNARLREVEWIDRVWKVMDRVEKNAPWRDHDRPDAFAPHRAFGPLQRNEFRHRVVIDEQTVIARVMSVSHVAVLPPSRRADIEREISMIVDAVEGPLEITYRTDVLVRIRS